MFDEELSRSTPDEAKELVRAKNALKETLQQQEKSINSALAGETDIAKKRQDYLTEYFNNYSRNLASIQEQYSSLLDNTFDLLNQKLTENYKSLSSEINKLERQLAFATSNVEKVPRDTSKENQFHRKYSRKQEHDQNSEHRLSQIQSQLKINHRYTQFSKNTAGPTPTGGAGGSNNNNIGIGAGNTHNSGDYVYDRIPEGIRAQLQPEETNGINLEEIAQLKKISNEAQQEITAAFKSGDIDQIDSARVKYGELGNLLIIHLQDLEKRHNKHLARQKESEVALNEKLLDLDLARDKSKEANALRLKEFLIKQESEVLDAKIKAQEAANEVETRLAAISNEKKRNTFGKQRAEQIGAEDSLKESQKRTEQIAKYQAQRELYYKQKNNGILSKEDAARVQKEINEKFAKQKKNEENLSKERGRLATIEYQKSLNEQREETRKGISEVFREGASIEERKQALYGLTHDENGNFDKGKAIGAALQAIADLAKQLESKIDNIAGYKGFIDTRLQGSNNKTNYVGSYWDVLVKDMMSVGAVSPFFKQEKFAENIKSLVDQGIAFDLKQRAFLMTIQEKIANTFEVADGTLLRLIRIQQEDSTAGRLGMESALNSFLNNMYENTEYLKTVASGVRSSLQEMEALMSGAKATEVEYQVQKWMGSLYSVGMSQEAVNSIATALGQIAAGQVDALTNGSGAGNLMVMAANEAGLHITDILARGLDASETNRLLQATVNYLAELAESSKDNQVVQQQLAGVFGIKASDLRAATNLATSEGTIDNIFKSQPEYKHLLNQLYKMASSMGMRTSMGEMMTNVWDNVQYSLAGSMASSPASYLVYKLASLLESTTGGIDIGLPLIMGNGLPVQFKVSDLMRAGSMAGGILGSFGSLISGLATSSNGALMLARMGIGLGSEGLQVTPRGDGINLGPMTGGGAQTTSESGYIGNASGSDIKDSTIQQNEDNAKKQMIEAIEEAEANQIDYINENVLKIYELLDEVANGKRSLSVKVSGYGLTNLGSNTSMSGAQGGVAGLLSNNASNGSSNNSLSGGFSNGSGGSSGYNGGSNGSGNGSVTDFGAGNGIDLSGWTMV